MKKIFYCLAILAISLATLYSCETENSPEAESVQMNPKIGIEEPLIIGYLDENKEFHMTADEQLIKDNWSYNLKEIVGLDDEIKTLTVFFEDGSLYIRGRGNLYGSTLLLAVDSANKVSAEGISCTSSDCADDSKMCVPKPDKKSCTECRNWIEKLTCTKTVTAVSLIDRRLRLSDVIN